jgi:hypothetical protein
MTVVRRAPDLDRRVSSLPSPQESSSFAGPEYLSNGWLIVADKVACQEQQRVGMTLVQMGQERAR